MQARQIAAGAGNVYVKIPVTNTSGESAVPLIASLARDGVQMNVTALFTEKQIEEVSIVLEDAPPSNISVFAGRIADAGNDPVPVMRRALEIMRPWPQQKLIWASPREVFNVVQADEIGCHIITDDPRSDRQAPVAGPRSCRILARHGEDVPPRRGERRLLPVTERPAGGISLIFPVAGSGADGKFRGFEMAGGESLIRRSLRAFLPFADRIGKIHYVVLEDHAARFEIGKRLGGEIDRPFELIRLSSPTRGPAESVARGIAKHGIKGPAIVCDIDHRLEAAPLFDAISSMPDADALVCLWPLAGEQLRRWSVACIDDARTSDRNSGAPHSGRRGPLLRSYRLLLFSRRPGGDGLLPGTGRRQLSGLFQPSGGAGPPRARRASRGGGVLRRRRAHPPAGRRSGNPRGTIFCDIDGTLVVHEDRPDYSRLPQLLPGAREKLRNWISQGFCVVLCTARAKQDEPRLAAMLRELDVPYHQLVTGLPSGVRILINDRKPHAMFTPQAASLEIVRDQGIGALEILAPRESTVLGRFKGGSFAETLLIEENGKTFVRKRAAASRQDGIALEGLRDQFHTVGRFARMAPGLVPALYGEENNSHEYFYDMEYLDGYRELSDIEPGGTRGGAGPVDEPFRRPGLLPEEP